jgi:hypothetical protein
MRAAGRLRVVLGERHRVRDASHDREWQPTFVLRDNGVETGKLKGFDSESYLGNVISRIADHPARRIGEMRDIGSLKTYTIPVQPWRFRHACPCAGWVGISYIVRRVFLAGSTTKVLCPVPYRCEAKVV